MPSAFTLIADGAAHAVAAEVAGERVLVSAADARRTLGYELSDLKAGHPELRAILDRRQPNVVRVLLEKWCAWAERSRLTRFLPVVRSIRNHMEGILGYIRTRLSCGMVEGLNGKVRLLVRRAYGFHSAAAVIAMVRLCCSELTDFARPKSISFTLPAWSRSSAEKSKAVRCR